MMKRLKITRVLDAPRGVVWKEWTDPAEVKKWWGPKDFTAPVVKNDLRVGGKYFYCMRGPDPQDGVVKDFCNTGEYVQVMPREKIVATDAFADQRGNPVPASYYGMPGEWPDITKSTVTFEDYETNKTKLTIRADELPKEMVQPAKEGWRESLDKLDSLLTKF